MSTFLERMLEIARQGKLFQLIFFELLSRQFADATLLLDDAERRRIHDFILEHQLVAREPARSQ